MARRQQDEDDEEPGVGHNNPVTKQELEKYIKRIEKITDERKSLSEDIRLVIQEAKSKGFDPKTIKEMIKLRAMDSEKRATQEELRDMYMAALGMGLV